MPQDESKTHTPKPRKRRDRAAAKPAKGARLPAGAAAAVRASAGLGTEDLEPADWLFGNSLRRSGS